MGETVARATVTESVKPWMDWDGTNDMVSPGDMDPAAASSDRVITGELDAEPVKEVVIVWRAESEAPAHE